MKNIKTILLIQKEETLVKVCSFIRCSKSSFKIKYMNEDYRTPGTNIIGHLLLENSKNNLCILKDNVPELNYLNLYLCGDTKRCDNKILKGNALLINELFEKSNHKIINHEK